MLPFIVICRQGEYPAIPDLATVATKLFLGVNDCAFRIEQ